MRSSDGPSGPHPTATRPAIAVITSSAIFSLLPHYRDYENKRNKRNAIVPKNERKVGLFYCYLGRYRKGMDLTSKNGLGWYLVL